VSAVHWVKVMTFSGRNRNEVAALSAPFHFPGGYLRVMCLNRSDNQNQSDISAWAELAGEGPQGTVVVTKSPSPSLKPGQDGVGYSQQWDHTQNPAGSYQAWVLGSSGVFIVTVYAGR
jgi:hypothetical protein